MKLTEDEEVFAVVTRTPPNFGSMTCFTDLGNTITINGLNLDDAEVEQSDGKLFSVLSDTYAALLGGLGDLSDELADAKIPRRRSPSRTGSPRSGTAPGQPTSSVSTTG